MDAKRLRLTLKSWLERSRKRRIGEPIGSTDVRMGCGLKLNDRVRSMFMLFIFLQTDQPVDAQ